MAGIQTQYESHETVYVNSISHFKPGENYAICKRLSDNINEKTQSGIFKANKAWKRDQFLPYYADRIFEVVKVPDEFTDEPQLGYWKTEIEVKVGDTVIVNFKDSLDAKSLFDSQGNEYRILKYYSLIVALRKKAIIPLNGYFLFTRLYEQIKVQSFHLEIPKTTYKFDPRVGKVEYVGTPVKYYYRSGGGDFDKGIDIKRGDNIMFIAPYIGLRASGYAIPLENPMFKIMDQDYFACQRYRVAGLLE